MPGRSSVDISGLLADWAQGNESARDALIPLVYEELRRIARRKLHGERPDPKEVRSVLPFGRFYRGQGAGKPHSPAPHSEGLASRPR